jgi:TonB family protein
MLKTTSRILVCLLLCAATGAATARAQTPQPQIDPTPVYTICTLLVGTATPGTEQQGVTMALSSSNLSALEAAQYAENLADLQEKLKATFRLDRVDVLSSFGDWMSPGRDMVLEAPGGGSKLVVTAQGVTEQSSGQPVRNADGSVTFVVRPGTKSANFNVRLTAGANVVFEKPWPVMLGSRSILARQAELNSPIYFIVIAAPIPGTPMHTNVGIEAQAYRVYQAERDAAAVRDAAAAARGVGVAIGGARGVGGGVAGTVTQMKTAGAGSVVRPPKLIHSLQPTLSAEARAAGLKGPVILDGTIGPDGSIQNIKVLKGVEGLNDIAIAAFRQWRYAPPDLDETGKPILMQIAVAFSFKDEPEGDR